VLATDASWYSSAFHEADEGFVVPRCDHADFLPRMLELCETERVDLVIPTIDPELPIYAAAREQFAARGTAVAVSSPEVVAIAGDKQLTHDWLLSGGFPTVAQGTPDAVRSNPDLFSFPVVLKPRFGSASAGVVTVHDQAGLDRAVAGAADASQLLAQQFARGSEHTIDVLLTSDTSGGSAEVSAIVPRRRIEVRSGEVAKAVTVRSPELMELAQKVCSALPGAWGPLNLQLFVGDGPGELAVIELNARFGGGVPLSIAAGADLPLALLQDVLGLPLTAPLESWRDDFVMLRYDAAVFLPAPDPTAP
jgi:carbamoyl-phosphate synthase large subunit